MRILGIDPGINITGYGCISVINREVSVLEAGVIKPPKTIDMSLRLADLYNNIKEVIAEHKPDVVVVEDVYSHTKYPKTAIIMGHARGCLLLAAGLENIEVVSYSANRIKKSVTGSGHASKEQMQRMVQQLLNLSTLPSPPDVADALCAAICHSRNIQIA